MNVKLNSANFSMLSVICLFLAACASNTSACETSVSDSIWQTFRGEEISGKVIYFRKKGAYEQAVELLGKPDKNIQHGDVKELVWIVGNRRSSKTFQCGKLTDETYQVSYELTKVSIADGRVGKCSLEVLNFIGPNESPDPFLEAPITSESMACE